jgi:DNA-binding NarL/FixJ family response regulator
VKSVPVVLQAPDPLLRMGLAALLEACPDITVLDDAGGHRARVLVVACERLTSGIMGLLRRSAAESTRSVVLVAGEIGEAELITAVECRVVAVLPRGTLTAERLATTVLTAARGGGVLSPVLVGDLMKHIERLHHEALGPGALSRLETDVLRLAAEGCNTAEIAAELSYSERTVKHILQGVTQRLHLRNRAHAVAYALRSGHI